MSGGDKLLAVAGVLIAAGVAVSFDKDMQLVGAAGLAAGLVMVGAWLARTLHRHRDD